MTDFRRGLLGRYVSALRAYIAGTVGIGTVTLQRAHELGRNAIADGLGSAALARLHEEALRALLPDLPVTQRDEGIRRAGDFLAAALVPFELAHRRLEEQLGFLSQERRIIAESSPDVLYRLDDAGNLIWWNKELEEVTGLASDELWQRPALDFFAPGDRPTVAAALGAVWEQGQSEVEAHFLTRNGLVPYHFKGTMVRNLTGEQQGVIGIGRNVSAYRAALAALQESEQRFRQLAENIREVFWLTDPQKNQMVYVSPAYEDVWGVTCESLYTRPNSFVDPIHPDDRERVMAAVATQAQGGYDQVYRIVRPDGTLRWIRDRAFPVHGAEGEVVRIAGISEDITERRLAEEEVQRLNQDLERRIVERTAELLAANQQLQSEIIERQRAEDALRESEERFRELFDDAPVGYHELDTDGRVVRVNRTELAMLGYAEDEMLGHYGWEFLDDAQRELSRQSFAEKMTSGVAGHNFERTYRRKDGTHLPVLIDDRVLRDREGQICGLRSVIQDITYHKRAAEDLRASEERYRELFENANDLVYTHDLAGNFTSVNAACVRVGGYSRDELLSMGIAKIVAPDQIDRAREAIARKIADPSSSLTVYELDIVAKDGRRIPLEVSTRLIVGEGSVVGVQGIARDITERKRSEEALHERARLAAELSLANAELAKANRMKDEFLASMSHELRTPLNTVIGLAEALQEEVYGILNDEQLQAIENVEESGRHLLALINDILDLAKIEAGRLDLEIAPVSVQAVCEASLRLVRQTAHQKRLHTSFSFGEPVTIPADERRLKQVLVNLLSNAVKFTPEGGKIGLEVKADREREAVHFAIWDTGIGIKPEDRPRLFTPFVQLDSALSRGYEGTGLGLSLVQRMVRLHGGGVAVESEPERGSRFTVSLPWPGAVSPALALAPAGGRVPRTGGGPFQQALIVEDSRIAGDQLSRYLDALGVDSIVHTTGADAVERAVAIGADLVLLDLLLPDGLGWDVLARLRSDSRTEAIPVVIVSVVDERSRGLAAGAADYLVKPVSAGQVQSAVRRLSTTAAQRSSLAATVIPVVTDSSEPRPRVLLADDNENNIKVLAAYLRVKGHEVIVARNGIEAIELVKGESPDVVLMDIQMPGMNGLEAIRRLRADAAHADVPIIALTALAMPGDRELCLAAGATDYLSKPVGLSLLARTIAYHLHQQPGSPTMPRSDRTSERSTVPPRGRANVETQN